RRLVGERIPSAREAKRGWIRRHHVEKNARDDPPAARRTWRFVRSRAERTELAFDTQILVRGGYFYDDVDIAGGPHCGCRRIADQQVGGRPAKEDETLAKCAERSCHRTHEVEVGMIRSQAPCPIRDRRCRTALCRSRARPMRRASTSASSS